MRDDGIAGQIEGQVRTVLSRAEPPFLDHALPPAMEGLGDKKTGQSKD
ncbi:MAG TPA: hypothetical protein VIB82_09330 [Caulobacteraceae bacterium]|jgi:hypothetical protein